MMHGHIINYSCLKLLNAKTEISNFESFGAHNSSREAGIKFSKSGVWTEIEVIICAPFTPHWKVL